MNSEPEAPSHMLGSSMKHSAPSQLSHDGPLPTLSVTKTFCKSQCFMLWMLSNKSAVP